MNPEKRLKQGILIHPEELTEGMLALLKGSGLNTLGLHPVGGKNAAESLNRLLELQEDPAFREKLTRVRSFGMQVEYEMHALRFLVPASLFSAHPDWFREDENGRRTPDHNICASNAEALHFLQERAALLAKKLPSDSGRYYFWADDVPHGACHCEKCRGLTPSDQALILYHAILHGVRQADPRAKLCYLAYQETMAPPENVRPEEGIFLEFAPMFRDTLTPLHDPASETNRRFLEKIPPLLGCFGREDAAVLEYWIDNSLFSGWKKPPKKLTINEETIREDIAFYRRAGFSHIGSFGCYLSDDYQKLYGQPPVITYGKCFTKTE